MTDHDAIAARVRQCAERARPCDCEVDDCIHDRAYQDAPDYDELSAAYLDLYDEAQRLRAALEEIADGLKGIARDIQIGPDDEGREIYDMVQAMQWDARQALKGHNQ